MDDALRPAPDASYEAQLERPPIGHVSQNIVGKGVPSSSAGGRLEAEGAMNPVNERLRSDPEYAGAYAAASDRYVAARNRLGPRVPRDDSAGGMPVRAKCLHTLYGHHLATRDNPVGAEVAGQVEPMACPGPCVSGQEAP